MSLRVLACALGYHPGQAGGAERQARLQAEELLRRGHDVTVVTPASPGLSSGTVDGVAVVRLPIIQRRPFRTVSYLASLATFLLLRARSFDVVHVHLANLQADVAVVVGRLLRRPVYVKVAAGGPIGEVGRFRRVSLVTRYTGLRRATRVQAISDEIERDLLSINVAASRIVRIPNGIRFAEATSSGEDAAAARAELGLPDTGVIVLYTGRFSPYKGLDDLIDAWRSLPRMDANLVLVGSTKLDPGPASDESHGVFVRPWSTDPERYRSAADIFVLPSHTEGMSNALLEAMMARMPVVATRVGAAEEVVTDGVDGLLVNVGDRAGIAHALDRLIADPEMRRRLGQAAASSIRSRYSIEHVVDRIEAVYFEIVGRA